MELNKDQKEFLATHFNARRYDNVHLYGTDQDYGMMYCIDLPSELFGEFDEWNAQPVYDFFRESVYKTEGLYIGLMIVDADRLLFDLYDKNGDKITEDGNYIHSKLTLSALKCGIRHKEMTLDKICANEYESAIWDAIKSVYYLNNISVSYNDLRNIMPYDEWRAKFLDGYNSEPDWPF